MRKSPPVLLQISLLCISILPATVEGKIIVTEVFPAQDEFICETPEISWLIESTEDKEIIMYELDVSRPEDEFLFYIFSTGKTVLEVMLQSILSPQRYQYHLAQQ